MKNILAKLLLVQKEIKPIIKDETNPHFKNKYFDINSLLAEVKPILNAHGLVLTQPLNGDALTTVIYDADSEETLMSSVNLPAVSDPQKMGSAISYYRRYSLVSLLGLEGEDDDGETTRQTAPNAPQSTQAPQQVQTPQYGTCQDCGANKVFNPKTGKTFCEKKCWLQPKQEVPVIDVEEEAHSRPYGTVDFETEPPSSL